MSIIHAPFNFVPLSDKVYFPKWADQISLDKPFKDGLDGEIELLLTAETPIFVRNGHKKDVAKEDNEYRSFSKTPDGYYFIPGTTLKGAIRNVLEIMSFGKMGRITKNRYALRDLSLNAYTTYFQNHEVHCGWMSREGNSIKITDNGIPFRVSHEEIDKHFSTEFVERGEDQKKLLKTAEAKYKHLGFKNSTNIQFIEELRAPNPVDNRKFAQIDQTGIGTKGTLVLTGQASTRQESSYKKKKNGQPQMEGKFYEFIFPSKIEHTHTFEEEKEEGLYYDFNFIYSNSSDWEYWRKKMAKGENVPVFFILKDGKIDSMGLSYLYKLPSSHSVYDSLPAEHKNNKYDLADCIFGTVNDKNSLKGRVQFSNAMEVEETCMEDALIEPYMGSPKPSYYPIYVKQKGENGENNIGYSTWIDENKPAQLRGWKRYPVRKTLNYINPTPNGQEDNTNPAIPLQEGAQFKCKVRFHNLKPIELGALINAINPGNNAYHSIGFAKAYGYGKTKVEIVGGCVLEGPDYVAKDIKCEEYASIFKEAMESVIPKWKNSEQCNELRYMMRDQKLTPNERLEYMELSEYTKGKVAKKKQGKLVEPVHFLPKYSEMLEKQSAATVAKEATIYEAEVIILKGLPTKKAKIIGNPKYPQSLPLQCSPNDKLKNGQIIKVEVVKNGKELKKIGF